jgi:hypothetical protein
MTMASNAPEPPPGLPSPLFDADGFPLPLLRVRRRVEASGGQVKGELHDWKLTHPRADLTEIGVHFLLDGDVLVEVGLCGRIYVDATMAYRGHPPGNEASWLDHTLNGILDGHYREVTVVDEDDQPVEHGYELSHQYGGDRRRRYVAPMPDDERQRRMSSWREDWYQYPAWPQER